MRKFDDYNVFSTSPAVYTFGYNYVFAAMCLLISSVSASTAIIPAVCTFSDLIRYCINGIYGHNFPVDVKKLRKLFLFNPDNIAMNNIEPTTQLGVFNQQIPMQHSNKQFLYSEPCRHKDDAIDTFF